MLKIHQLTKQFASGFVISLDIEVESGITVLFGRSGCGKTTTLGMISGLIDPDRGRIALDDSVFFDAGAGLSLPSYEREVGYIFQQPSLFPHLTVDANIRYGTDHQSDISDLVARFEIDSLLSRYPREISGGQQQRVSLARSLASNPRALLMDEPFSALDAGVRTQFQSDLLRVKEQTEMPILVVTHSISEAFALADRLIVMDEGHVVESYDALELFARPRKRVTAELLGVQNLMPCRVKSRLDGAIIVEFQGLDFVVDDDARCEPGDSAWLGIRAVDVRLVVTDSRRENELVATVHRIIRSVVTNQIHLNGHSPDGDFSLVMDLDEHHCKQHHIKQGDTVRVALKRNKAFICQ
ncbi:MAG: ABC transporter ATP-binding protein [Candidatus Latescibacteria bacterium]|nr:ABC transporter ATP-binding protein [Candidatus Latescibacterota bacterium]